MPYKKAKDRFIKGIAICISGVAFIVAVMCMTVCTCKAGRISDYVYDDNLGADGVIVSNRKATKCIALTFDDGPHPTHTPEILDILREHDVKATFFVIGQNAKKHPEIVRREYEEGHEIGNHTFTHPHLKTTTVSDFVREVSQTSDTIEEITGVKPVLFRPPGGYLKNDFVSKIRELDCTSVLWSWRQDTRDWENPPVDRIVNTVLSNIQSGDIILFHDFHSGKSPTPAALKILIPKLRNMGYSFVTVSDLMHDGQIIDN